MRQASLTAKNWKTRSLSIYRLCVGTVLWNAQCVAQEQGDCAQAQNYQHQNGWYEDAGDALGRGRSPYVGLDSWIHPAVIKLQDPVYRLSSPFNRCVFGYLLGRVLSP